MKRLRRADIGRQMRLVEPDPLVAAAIGMEPTLVMLTMRRLLRQVNIVPGDHQLDMVEAHIGAHPARIIGALPALRLSGRLEGVEGGEVRLADEAGLVTGIDELAGEAGGAHLVLEVDAIV